MPVNGISTSSNSLELGCEIDINNGATAASYLNFKAEISASEYSRNPSSKTLGKSRLNRLIRELPRYTSTLNINDEDSGVYTTCNIYVAEASSYQWSVRLSRAKESVSMRVSSLYNSTTNANYSENGDGDDSFYKLLRCW
jgi:hypothetical protein